MPLAVRSGHGILETGPVDGVVGLCLDQSTRPSCQCGMVDKLGVVAVEETSPEHLDMVFVFGRYSLEFVPCGQLIPVLIVALDAVQPLEKTCIFNQIDPIVVVGTVANVPKQIAEGIACFEIGVVPSFQITLHLVGNAGTAGMELCEHFRRCAETMDVPTDDRAVLQAQAIPVIPAILLAEARRATAIGRGAGKLRQMADKVEVFLHIGKESSDKLGFHETAMIYASFHAPRQERQRLGDAKISTSITCLRDENPRSLPFDDMAWQSPQDEIEARGEQLAECIRRTPTIRQALALTVSHVGEAIDLAIDHGGYSEEYKSDQAAFCQLMHDSEDDLDAEGVRGWRLAWRVAREAFYTYEHASLMTEEELLADIFADGPYDAGRETVAKETYVRNFFAGATELLHAWAQRFHW